MYFSTINESIQMQYVLHELFPQGASEMQKAKVKSSKKVRFYYLNLEDQSLTSCSSNAL